MNIIYLLTNKSRPSGRRYYIGSKAECKLLEVDGVPTIYSVSTGKPYMSSSCCPQFKADVQAGHVFAASILKVVGKREELREEEDKFIREADAVSSRDYYNMSGAFANTHDREAVKNCYGETVVEYANRSSQASKRDGTARQEGFSNFGEFYLHLHDRLLSGESTADVATSYGKHRKWVQVTLRHYDMLKARTDLNRHEAGDAIREMMAKGASLKYAADKLQLELPAARVLLGDFDKYMEKSYSVAKVRGKSKAELEVEITNRVLDGEGFVEICNSMALCRESVLRYFLRCLRGKKDQIKNLL